MKFANRAEAGQQLASRLGQYASQSGVLVLGVPRGGVPVAFEIATALRLPLDIFVLRKLGVPGHEELAFGAIASGGIRVLDDEILQSTGLSDLIIEAVTREETAELARREQIYRGGRPALDVDGKTLILVDDGIATGSSLRAGVQALRQMQPAAIVIAAPVAPESTIDRLRREVDQVICVAVPEDFHGVGQFYRDFSQVSDEEVEELLNRAWQQRASEQSYDAESDTHNHQG